MKQYIYFLTVAFLLFGCSGTTTVQIGELPPPTVLGSSYFPPATEYPPAAAVSYSVIDGTIDGYGDPVVQSIATNYGSGMSFNDSEPPSEHSFTYTFNNVIYKPRYSHYYGDYFASITYPGDRFVQNDRGFAEQITNFVDGYGVYSDGFNATKLLVGGGLNGLNYTDFGYWIGIPKNTTKDPVYLAFASMIQAPHSTYHAEANTSFVGKTAAIAYSKTNGHDYARELGGDATLTIDASKNAHLNLDFQDYYTFDIYTNYSNYISGGDQSMSSVIVTGANTNGGPAFNSCVSGCNSVANIQYFYSGIYLNEEAAGTYKYTSGTNELVGSFGAIRN